jgi:hypothetical protein
MVAMTFVRTTPPRPFDVAAVFPRLGPLARPAYRLHPRQGSPSPYESSVGGPLLWPADQPWPSCDRWHEGPPSPLVPVAQLYAHDVPLLGSLGRADLLQVLWCPSEHPPEYKPPTVLFWRNAAAVTDVLTAPPEPTEVEYDHCVPKPCVLAPERITEYPAFLDLSKESRRWLADWGTWQAAEAVVDDSYEIAPQEFYMNELSVAPGWKVGGWPPWGRTDPIARFCVACGAAMSPLLTIASTEWSANDRGWVPYEDQALVERHSGTAANPPGVHVGSTDHLQLYVCPNFPGADHPYPGEGHPHTDLVQ